MIRKSGKFPLATNASVGAEIMFKPRDEIMIRFNRFMT
jgi:hypothetical protein